MRRRRRVGTRQLLRQVLLGQTAENEPPAPLNRYRVPIGTGGAVTSSVIS